MHFLVVLSVECSTTWEDPEVDEPDEPPDVVVVVVVVTLALPVL